MGHIIGKDLYQQLGASIDRLPYRAPWNETFALLLRELYSADEADLIIKMPTSLSTLKRLVTVTGLEETRLRKLLEALCTKGLVMDFRLAEEYHYMPSPLVVGIFELTMMRTARDQDWKKISGLFHEYMLERPDFIAANCSHGEKIGLLRTVPHEATLQNPGSVEILDYERASALIEDQQTFAIGTCACRHTSVHNGSKSCSIPLDTCSAFGIAAEFLTRRGFARKVSREEMKENVARSKELGLVLNVDNVQKNPAYLCHCCSDCCHLLLGLKKWGYTNIVITSGFLPETDLVGCTGCGLCARACPVEARTMVAEEKPAGKRRKRPAMDTALCLGCGVCALKCRSNALTLRRAQKRTITPETTFERIMLQCLERGTLEQQLFDDPARLTHRFLRSFVGGFLRLKPVKRALMSDALHSTFLAAIKKGASAQGKGWMTEL